MASPKRSPVLLKALQPRREMIEEVESVVAAASAGRSDEVGRLRNGILRDDGFARQDARKLRTLAAGVLRKVAITTNGYAACYRVGLS